MERSWISKTELPACGETFTVMQWNILAQTLAVNGRFEFATPEMLAWEHRKQLIIKEVLQYKPDLVCLEEVDCFQLIKEDLQCHGYRGEFLPKPSSPCLKYQDNIGPDGNVVLTKPIGKSGRTHHKILSLEDGAETNSTVLIDEFEVRGGEHVVFLLATHLKASQSASAMEIRRQQAEHLVRIVQELKASQNSSVIICGDFNAEPEEPAIQILKKSGLKSAYEEILGEEPKITTYKTRLDVGLRARCIDYIFYCSEKLAAVSVVDLPTSQQLSALATGGLPNLTFPSDHPPLLVKFKLDQ